MNKKGQSLVIFIVFLPIILMALALVIDTGIMYNAKTKGNNLLKEAKKYDYDIDEYFEKNNYPIISKKNGNDNEDCVIITSRVKSVFGTIIGKKEYEIIVSDCK